MTPPPARKFQPALRLALAVVSGLYAACVSAGPASAWGNVAHRAISSLAERHLTPEAATEAKRLLALENAESLSGIAMWADQIRRMEIPGTPDHDVPIPLTADGYDAARDCKTFCIVKAISFYTDILSDRTRTDAQRLEALKYVVHFVGDVHQPLHASQDGGGELVTWDGKTVYLHILWDVTIVTATYPTPDALAAAMAERVRPTASCGAPEQWANESHYIAKTYAFTALGPDRRQPIALPPEYAPAALPMIEDRVALAAARLACVLNEALKPRP